MQVKEDNIYSKFFINEKNGQYYCLVIALIATIFQYILLLDIPLSPLWAEDYNYLNRAIYYIQGDFALEGYPFGKKQSGLLYYLLITPWVYFDLGSRFLFLYGVNALLYGVSVYFTSMTIARLTKSYHILVPIFVGTLPFLFQFPAYIMTENLLFALLSILMYLFADSKFLDDFSKKKLIGIFILVLCLTQTRIPGLAVVPGLLYLVLSYVSLTKKHIYYLCSLVFFGVCIVFLSSFLFDYKLSREMFYVEKLFYFFSTSTEWISVLDLVVSQIEYIFLSSYFWVVIFSLFFYIKVEDNYLKKYYNFSLIIGGFFLMFTLAHLIPKQLVYDQGSWFIYGRYNDPVLLIVSILGVVGLFYIKSFNVYEKFIFHFLVPIFFIYALNHVFIQNIWKPVNQCGLTLLALDENSTIYSNIWMASVLLLCCLSLNYKQRQLIFLLCIITFNVFTNIEGYKYTKARAEAYAPLIEAADWFSQNTSSKTTICYDYTVKNLAVPGLSKKVGNTYRAMAFFNYPRKFQVADSDRDLKRCSFLFSVKDKGYSTGKPLLWGYKDYGIFPLYK